MKKKALAAALTFTALDLFSPAFAAEIDSINGTFAFSEDTVVTVPAANLNFLAYAIRAGAGTTISGAPDLVINLKNDRGTGNNLYTYGIYAENGGTVDLSSAQIIAGDDGGFGGGLAALSGGTIKIGDNSKLSGDIGRPVYSSGSGSSITIGDNTIIQGHEWGSGGAAVHAVDNSRIIIGKGADISSTPEAGATYFYDRRGVQANTGAYIYIGDDSTITTKGVAGVNVSSTNHGVIAGDVGGGSGIGTVELGDRVTVDVEGRASYGLFAYTPGSKITAGESTQIITRNDYGYGIAASNNGTQVSLGERSSITTIGNASHGINAQSGAVVDIGAGSIITTSGNSTLGISTASGAKVNLGDGVRINTSGTTAYGMQSDGAGSLITIGDNFYFESTNNGSRGAQTRRGGQISIGNNATFITDGQMSHGIYGGGTNSEPNSTISVGENLTIVTKQYGSYGVRVGLDNAVTIGNGASITTSGDLSSAMSTSGGNLTIGKNLTVNTAGSGAHGLLVSNGGVLSTEEKAIVKATGTEAYGVLSSGTDSFISIGANSEILATGVDAHGIVAESGGQVQLAGAKIESRGTDSASLFATGIDSQILGDGIFGISGETYAMNNGKVDLKMRAGSSMTSDLFAGSDGDINILLADNSMFTGVADQQYGGTDGTINLTMTDNSRWNMTGDWNANLMMMGGSLYFHDNDDSAVMTVHAHGDVTMNGGTLHFNTDIANQQSDYLIVGDGIRGSGASVYVNNNGSAMTTGDELVPLIDDQVPTAGNPATFTLTHVVELGGYNYLLDQRDDGQGGNEWYLRGVEKEKEREITTAASVGIQMFSGSYLLNYAENQTLMKRMGDLRDGKSRGNVWARTYGGNFENHGNRLLKGFDMDYWGLQAGMDKKITRKDGKGTIYVGGMFGYSKGNLDFGKAGSGSADSKSIGAYGTYMLPNGLYADLVLKYGWMENDYYVRDSAGQSVIAEDIDSQAFSGSLEIGKRFHFDQKTKQGFYMEPQAQITWGHQEGATFTASNGLKTKVDSYNSILGRFGTLVGYEMMSGKNPVNVYAKWSWVKEFDGEIDFSLNRSKETTSYKGSWHEWGVGITAELNKKHNVYLEVERTTGGPFKQTWAVNGGYRFTW